VSVSVRSVLLAAAKVVVVLGVCLGALGGVAAFLAPSASAAPESAWDRLAQCESGGNWQINTGNGYYGGLQFSLRTWRAFGGTGMPHQASKAQQIAVAERTLAVQGWNAWPSCSRKAGVRGHAAEPAGRTIVADAPLPTAPAVAPAVAGGSTYTVKSGDTLSKIAAANNVPGGWQAIYQANRGKISDPNKIKVGQQLVLPV
jgi:resuscitation-promoting factor RpfA